MSGPESDGVPTVTAAVPGPVAASGAAPTATKAAYDWTSNYSKWDKIEVDDDDDKKKKKPAATAEAVSHHCGSCHAVGATMRCGVCKKVWYCKAECQKSDWPFHKRVCARAAPKPAAAAAPSDASKAPPSGGGGGDPRRPPSSSSSGASALDDADLSKEEADAVREAAQGYAYFSKPGSTPPAAASAGPRRIDAPAEASAASTPAAAAAAATGLESAAMSPGSLASASAWNATGSYEERHMTGWFQDRLRALVVAAPPIATPGGGSAVVETLENFEGDADIMIVRGRARYIYEVTFKVVVAFRAAEASAPAYRCELRMSNVSNDSAPSDYKCAFSWAGSAPSPAELEASARAVAMGGVWASVLGCIATVLTGLATC